MRVGEGCGGGCKQERRMGGRVMGTGECQGNW